MLITILGVILCVLILGVAAALIWPRVVIRSLFRACFPLFRVEVVGAEHLQSTGPAVYVANHVSLLDGPLIVGLVARKLAIVADTRWANGRLLRMFRSAFEIAPIDPQRPMSAKTIAKKVSEGAACLIFPEGRVTVTGAPMKINGGAAWLVDAGKADVIAIHIEGLERSSMAKAQNGWRKVWFPKVRVTVAPPQSLVVSPELRGKARREAVTRALRDIMENLRYDALMHHNNILDAIDEASDIHGAKTVIYEDILENTLTYGNLRLGGRVLGKLFAKSIPKGSTVGLLLPTAPAALAVLSGLWRARLTPAILNHTVGAQSVTTTLGVVNADTIVSSRVFVEKGKLMPFVQGLEENGIKFVWLEDLRQSASLWIKLSSVMRKREDLRDITRDTPAAILFTSGTEGPPKGVVLSHGNILANCAQLRARANLGPKDIAVSALPVFHSFGLTAGLILPAVCGIRTGLHPSPLHYRIIPELAYSLQATLLFGTDTFLNGWARRADPQDFASLRAVVAGAEAVKDTTRQTWANRFGVRVLEGYGATECGPVLSLNTPSEPDIGTVGRLLPRMEMRLEHMAGIDGARLFVRGPNVMRGYILASNPGQLQPPPEGWYDTGDAVQVDDQGRIRIVGRIKRFAKVAGEMVSLHSVEAIAQKLWPSAAVAALNRPHPRTGEQVILLTTDPKADRGALVDYAKANNIGQILLPAKVLYKEKLPLLATGKIDYPALTKILIDDGL